MMTTLSQESITSYRARTYRLDLKYRVKSKEEAIAFANERGFIMFWPIKGVRMPSLWNAVVGNRPVPNTHDDPGHVTWDWKDSTLGERVWYYAKVLRKKATIISLDIVPYFYALSENYGTPEEDYLDQYQQGTLTQEAKLIYEVLLRNGPLHTVALRKATFMAGKKSSYRFGRGLDELQADFKVLPIGVAKAGAWNYAFIYDCVHRHYPELPERARSIGIDEARRKLTDVYFQSVGAAQLRDVQKVFRWPKPITEKAIKSLVKSDILRDNLSLEGKSGKWIALADL